MKIKAEKLIEIILQTARERGTPMTSDIYQAIGALYLGRYGNAIAPLVHVHDLEGAPWGDVVAAVRKAEKQGECNG